jgi:hypothetical protein
MRYDEASHSLDVDGDKTWGRDYVARVFPIPQIVLVSKRPRITERH